MVAHGLGDSRMRVAAVLLEFDGNLSGISNLPQGLYDLDEIHLATAHLPGLAGLRCIGLVLDVDVVNPFPVLADVLGGIEARAVGVAQIHAAADSKRWVTDLLDNGTDVGEGGSVRPMGMDRNTDAGLLDFLDDIVQKFVGRNTDEHVVAVSGDIFKCPVDLLPGVHVDRSENIAVDTGCGAFCLECFHLLHRGVQWEPEVFDGQIFDIHAPKKLQSLVNVVIPVRETRDSDVELIGSSRGLHGLCRDTDRQQKRSGCQRGPQAQNGV